ncbi:MAG: aminotransferase class V-fold PLP-dependent enzyme [Deltaproteobacteria bacterium]|nr:aminotransferase class V-fold PLP-dependent enzyme [Deltaproteobacteria bacterium]
MTPPAYLDQAATSFPKAPGVSAAMASFLDGFAGNPGRGGHRLTVAASRAVEAAREAVAALLGAEPERTLFGPGCTFWLNTLLDGLLGTDDAVVCSSLEHNAVMRPLRWLEESRGVSVHPVPASDPHGVPEPEEVAEAVVRTGARLVVLAHASNVSGAVLPVEEIARAVAPVPVVVDAAQSAGSVPIDFARMGVAALACSAHKGLLGPTGVGILLLAPGFELPPLVRGGTGSRSESEQMPEMLPDLLEAGTPNTVGIVGTGAASAWLRERGVASVHAHERRLALRAAEGLVDLPGVELPGWSPTAPRTGTFSFCVRGLDNGALAHRLDRENGLLMRVGLHCAPAAHRRLGSFPDGTIRASFGPFNTESDADRLVSAIAAIVRATGSNPEDRRQP